LLDDWPARVLALVVAEILLHANGMQFETVPKELMDELSLRIDRVRLFHDDEGKRNIAHEKGQQKHSSKQAGVFGWHLHKEVFAGSRSQPK
jgi:hypothetical protein